MNRTNFRPCVIIDTSESLSGDFALPIKLLDRGDNKLHRALLYEDPGQQYLIRKKRGLALIRLEDFFVDTRTHAPTTEEIYDRVLLKGLKRAPSYAGIFFLTQHHQWLRENKLSSCLIGSKPFKGTDGKKYIPEVSDFSSIDGSSVLGLRARRADNDTWWSSSEYWLFETTSQ